MQLVPVENGDGNAGADGVQKPKLFKTSHALVRPPARISLFWGLGNNLNIAYFSTDAHDEGEGEGEDEGGALVFQFRGGDNQGPEKRALAYASSPLFDILHAKKRFRLLDPSSLSFDWWEHVLEYSRSMSALLGSSGRKSPNNEDFLLKDIPKPNLVKATWDLIEIFYVDKHSMSWLPERLTDWLWEHDGALAVAEMTIQTKLLEYQDIFSQQSPESDRRYWDGIASALTVGWFDIAVRFLRMHGSYGQFVEREMENGLVEAVAVLISEMPRMRPNISNGGLGRCFNIKPDFSKALEKWKQKVQKLKNSSFLNQCSNHHTPFGLQQLLNIMLGNMDALSSVTCHWIELLVSQFLFFRPFASGSEEMVSLAQRCILLKPPKDKRLAELMLGIMGINTEVVLAECSYMFDPWMLVHMIELITAKNQQAESLLCGENAALGGISLEELYRLVYAQVLSSHPFTWQISASYLGINQCQDLNFLGILLLRLQSIGNEQLTLKVLDICRLYCLEHIGVRIMKIAGIHHWKHGKKGQGILWLQRAQDETRLAGIAEQISGLIEHTTSNYKFQQLESMINLLGPGSDSSGGLAFLQKYKDFKTVLQNVHDIHAKDPKTKEIRTVAKDAVNCLVQLIKNPATPSRFWPSLLSDSVELLTWPGQAIISISETNLLLNKLQQLSLVKAQCDLESSFIDQSSRSLQRVRLALATNIGRGMLESESS